MFTRAGCAATRPAGRTMRVRRSRCRGYGTGGDEAAAHRRLRHHPALRYRAGIVIGLGAFGNEILFHQVLRWHDFVSDTAGSDTTTVDGLNAKALADGLFHAVS